VSDSKKQQIDVFFWQTVKMCRIVVDITVALMLIWNRIVQPVTGKSVFTDSSEVKHCKEMWDTLCAIMNDVGFSEEVSLAMFLVV